MFDAGPHQVYVCIHCIITQEVRDIGLTFCLMRVRSARSHIDLTFYWLTLIRMTVNIEQKGGFVIT